MDLNMYLTNKFKNFNEFLETHWHDYPNKYKEIQTLLFFQAYTTKPLSEKFEINFDQALKYPTLRYYFQQIEKYIHIPPKQLFPNSFHRPYEHILNEFKYLSFYQEAFEFHKNLEKIRNTFNKISIPIASHAIYTEILQYLNLSFEYLADPNLANELKIKLIYQWQDIHNLETVAAYKSLEKIKTTLNHYRQNSCSEYYFNLIQLGENQRIEFKERTTDLLTNRKSDKWVKACFAFMNTRNGYVFIGVADDLTIVGIENELAEHFNNSLDLMKRSLIDKLAHESNKISNIYTTLEEIQIQGKTILVFKCNKSDRPLYYKGELLMRTNGQTTRVPPELIESFRVEFYC
ncbi:AlbA family DNA-binding domain-containing protein [Acinetobacter guillouiae]|uniref:Schlafen AlbA-2 domain-containing protein n=1 Tax=Acinetobacter guillouiae NIPH 991 TaxID=1217656 RepID=N8WVU3_ACIGI|nr:ATP-binding protein [Acinetobacter guillouiae]ENV16061.1 hypothetical protein F964_02996 [Acinetobacter guillouiae NIPH 991]